MTAWLDRWQALVAIGGAGVGVLIGLALPQAAPTLELLLVPALVALLTATFVGVPFTEMRAALGDRRVLVVILGINIVLVPLIVVALVWLVPLAPGVLTGVVLVLLAPCIDYVIVFTRLAGGAADRLLAVTPLLMIAQMVMLPLLVPAIVAIGAGPDSPDAVTAPLGFGGAPVGPSVASTLLDPSEFVVAFGLFIVVPLVIAFALQVRAPRSRVVGVTARGVSAAMVPLLALVIALVVGAHLHTVLAHLDLVGQTVPVFIGFALVAALVGWSVARVGRVDAPGRIAVAMSAMTRNSLVVLPFAMVLVERMPLAPAVVVTQTLTELVILLVAVGVLSTVTGRSSRLRP